MAIFVSSNAYALINAVDLSNHCSKVTVNDAQETKEVRVMGTAYALARPGYSTPSIEFTFYNDRANGSVEATLRALIDVEGTGVDINTRPVNTAESTDNPNYYMDGILDGDLVVMDDEAGELQMITARFLPYSTFSVYTSAT